MLEKLKEEVYRANMFLVNQGLVVLTWGNASAFDKDSGLVVIKPSGVPFEHLCPDNMVVTDIEGNTVEGEFKPSTDLPTHLVLYKSFPKIGGVVHTHSKFATSFAQAGRGIHAYGTTHADTFHGMIPCTKKMTETQIYGEYERETGNIIVDTSLSCYEDIPAALVHSHGPFVWGDDAMQAAHNALILENVAEMALYSERLNATPIQKSLLDRHFYRKHGANSYYGQ